MRLVTLVQGGFGEARPPERQAATASREPAAAAYAGATLRSTCRPAQRGPCPPDRPPGRTEQPTAATYQSLSSRHVVRASLARVRPVGSVRSRPSDLPICSSLRATLLWCRWRSSAARRTEPAEQ